MHPASLFKVPQWDRQLVTNDPKNIQTDLTTRTKQNPRKFQNRPPTTQIIPPPLRKTPPPNSTTLPTQPPSTRPRNLATPPAQIKINPGLCPAPQTTRGRYLRNSRRTVHVQRVFGAEGFYEIRQAGEQREQQYSK
jgi:hypothetical protein